MVKKAKLKIHARKAFKDFLNDRSKFSTLVVHRRGGKTVACVQKLVTRALTNPRQKPPPRYAYLAPTRDQAKDIAWGYIKQHVGPMHGSSFNEAELIAKLPNGAQIRLYSGDNYERMRGLYFDGVVSDEDADIPPEAFEYVILPCLLDYDGWHTRIGTPKGRDAFYRAFIQAQQEPDRYALKLPITESGVFTPEKIEMIRKSMKEESFKQEMLCDFDIPKQGAIYAAEVQAARDSGRVGAFSHRRDLPVWTSWDLGAPENTVVVYWQRHPETLQWMVIDCDCHQSFEGKVMTTAERVASMKSRGYAFAGHLVPHDSKKVDVDGLSFEAKLKEAGLPNVIPVPRESHRAEQKRIDIMSDLFPSMLFSEEKTEGDGFLLDALSGYHRKIDRKTDRVGDEIVHDWCSHFADSFGTFGQALRLKLVKVPGDMMTLPSSADTPTRTQRSRDRKRQTSAQM